MNLPVTPEQANQIKHRLRQQGLTLKAFADEHNFTYRTVSDVLRGVNKASFGEGREVAIALGLIKEDREAA